MAIKSSRYLPFSYPALQQGVVMGIMGSNSMGKTTLANCLCGLLEPKGEILRGSRLNKSQQRRKFSLVMQDVNHQRFAKTVIKELTHMHKEPNADILERAEAIAEEMNMKELHA